MVVAFSPPVLEFVVFCVLCRFLWSIFIFFPWEKGPKSLGVVPNTNELPG